MTPDDVVEWPIVESVAVSPSGSVAFTVRRLRRDGSAFVRELWCGAATGKRRRLAYGIDASLPLRFSPSGRRLAYVQIVKRAGRPEHELQLVAIDDPDVRTQVGLQQRPRAFCWSPAADAIYCIRDNERPERPIGKSRYLSASRAYRHGAPSAPAVLERLEPGKPPLVLAELDPGAGQFAVCPTGTRIAYLTNLTGLVEDDAFELRCMHLDVLAPECLAVGLKGLFGPLWADTSSIVVAARSDERFSFSQTVARIVDVEDGATRLLATAITGEMRAVQKAGDTLLVSVAEGLTNNLWQVRDGEASRVVENVLAFDSTRDGRWRAYVREAKDRLPEVEVVDCSTGGQKQLTSYSRHLRDLTQPQIETVHWRGYQGDSVEGALVLPASAQPAKNLPTLVSIHGGPFHRAQVGLQNWGILRAWVLATAGYAVLMPNYHGSSAYGERFSVSLFGEIGVADYADIMTGVDYLINVGIADPERLGVFGGSYGGYLTNWIISQTDRFKAAVSQFGIWDLIGDYGNTSEDLWPPRYLGMTYLEDQTLHRLRSPSTYVEQIRTPVLLAHGEEDQNVFINNSQEMWRALHTLGRPVEFVRYPGEGHGYVRPAHQVDDLSRTLAWFDRYLRARPD
jgi:dipeptidyl aminopeptidase/acylaminoacyl peptidase